MKRVYAAHASSVHIHRGAVEQLFCYLKSPEGEDETTGESEAHLRSLTREFNDGREDEKTDEGRKGSSPARSRDILRVCARVYTCSLTVHVET